MAFRCQITSWSGQQLEAMVEILNQAHRKDRFTRTSISRQSNYRGEKIYEYSGSL